MAIGYDMDVMKNLAFACLCCDNETALLELAKSDICRLDLEDPQIREQALDCDAHRCVITILTKTFNERGNYQRNDP